MKLFYTVTSPFARKIRLSAHLLELEKSIDLVTVDVFNDADYKKINPLVKVPSLEIHEGLILTNSPFILEYLDSISLNRKNIPSDKSKWQALQFQSVADGIMEAAVLRRLESLRSPDKQDPKSDQRQKEKIENGLNYFEAHFYLLKTPWTVAEISLVCALGYLEFRFAGENWLNRFPKLTNWFKDANSFEFVRATDPTKL